MGLQCEICGKKVWLDTQLDEGWLIKTWKRCGEHRGYSTSKVVAEETFCKECGDKEVYYLAKRNITEARIKEEMKHASREGTN